MKILTLRFPYVYLLVVVLLAFAVSACTPAAEAAPPTSEPSSAVTTLEPQPSQTALPTNTPVPFELSSPAFENEGVIPDLYSCKGLNVSPVLRWGEPPAGTQSFAIIFDDPDAGGGGWVHWIVYGIPVDFRELHEAFGDGEELTPGGLYVGVNSWDLSIYRGPCPPEGSTHSYIFRLYALDSMMDLEPRLSKRELLASIEGHVLAEIELSASFSR